MHYKNNRNLKTQLKMQVFTPYPQPYCCAARLDSRRLNKQIIECKQILAAIRGESQAWRNHPVVKQYTDYTDYLKLYMLCLQHYKAGNLETAMSYSDKAMIFKPNFLTDEFCNQHKRRLYTKSNTLYAIFAEYGESQENWYFVNGKLLRYINGKKIN